MQHIQQVAQSQYSEQFASITDEHLKSKLQKTTEEYAKEKTQEFDDTVHVLKEQIAFLDLKQLIKKIFGYLIVSLLFVMLYHLVKVHLYGCFGLKPCYHLHLSLFLLFLSGVCFAYSLYLLWKIVCIIIDNETEQRNFISNNEALTINVGDAPIQEHEPNDKIIPNT